MLRDDAQQERSIAMQLEVNCPVILPDDALDSNTLEALVFAWDARPCWPPSPKPGGPSSRMIRSVRAVARRRVLAMATSPTGYGHALAWSSSCGHAGAVERAGMSLRLRMDGCVPALGGRAPDWSRWRHWPGRAGRLPRRPGCWVSSVVRQVTVAEGARAAARAETTAGAVS